MTTPWRRSPSIPRTYAALRAAVEEVVRAGRRRIEAAWVRTYHETGRLIADHVLLHRERADYGAQTVARLAEEVGISKRTLHECVQFYRCFPIVRRGAQLSWRQYRLLCQVADARRRSALLAELEGGGGRDGVGGGSGLEARVRALNAATAEEREETEQATAGTRVGGAEGAVVQRRLKARRGTPGLYRVVSRDGGLAVDVGFKFYLPLGGKRGEAPRGVEAGAIVRERDGEFVVERGAMAAELFTYRAKVRRVVDGDTLLVTLALPHGRWMRSCGCAGWIARSWTRRRGRRRSASWRRCWWTRRR